MDKKHWQRLLNVVIIVLVVTGCGKKGGETTSATSKMSVSGTVSAPSGTLVTSLSVTSLGAKSSISPQGNFTTQVYRDGVAVVAAMPAGKKFGLMNVVATNTSQPTARAVVTAAAASGTAGISNLTIDANTTAVSMVFISPFFVTNDPATASTLIPVIENDPKVAALASAIETTFGLTDPMSDPRLKQAFGEAIQSVIDTLVARQQTVTATVRTTASGNGHILRVPKKSSMGALVGALAMSSTPYYADQDYTIVKAQTSVNSYGITVATKNGGGVDWDAEVMKLDPAQFSSFSDLQAKASNNRTVYENEKASIIGHLGAPAQSFFRYVDLIQTGMDYTFENSFGEKPLKQVPISSTEDGIYLVRSYSGAPGVVKDSDEEGFVLTQVPNGPAMFTSSLATNILMVALDATSIFVPSENLRIGTAVKAGLKTYQNDVSLVSSPKINDLMGITADVVKAMVETASVDAVEQGFLSEFQDLAKTAVNFVNLPAGISSIGKIADRLLQMFVSATPMETAIVVVGDPFSTLPPSTRYTVRGTVRSSSNAAPVPGALVGIGDKTTVTDKKGSFTLSVPAGNNSLYLEQAIERFAYKWNVPYTVNSDQNDVSLILQEIPDWDKKMSPPPYRAFAINLDTWAGGLSQSFTSADSAVLDALDKCGDGCFVPILLSNACFAFARGDSSWHYSGRLTLEDAVSGALEGCNKESTGCTVVVSGCAP